ncbi:hypothetical protein Pfo_004861 [Paulownia fortunei]|nr:hypothetical protein Pfo_004861 [Paulownia fortunei]
MDRKTDEEFMNFMGSPFIEASIKSLIARSDNPIVGFFNNLVRENLSRETLEKVETFRAIDLNKLKSCFLIKEVIPKLEELSEAAGREVVVWLMEERTNEITKQRYVLLLLELLL